MIEITLRFRTWNDKQIAVWHILTRKSCGYMWIILLLISGDFPCVNADGETMVMKHMPTRIHDKPYETWYSFGNFTLCYGNHVSLSLTIDPSEKCWFVLLNYSKLSDYLPLGQLCFNSLIWVCLNVGYPKYIQISWARFVQDLAMLQCFCGLSHIQYIHGSHPKKIGSLNPQKNAWF